MIHSLGSVLCSLRKIFRTKNSCFSPLFRRNWRKSGEISCFPFDFESNSLRKTRGQSPLAQKKSIYRGFFHERLAWNWRGLMHFWIKLCPFKDSFFGYGREISQETFTIDTDSESLCQPTYFHKENLLGQWNVFIGNHGSCWRWPRIGLLLIFQRGDLSPCSRWSI